MRIGQESKPGTGSQVGLPRPQHTLYVTAQSPCPYLPERWERKLITELTGPQAGPLYDSLTHAGFRRSHNYAYRPACANCQACVPVRVPVDSFFLNRSFRRVWRKNRDLSGHFVPARATFEQFEIFAHYTSTRHGRGEMATMGYAEYRSMIEETSLDTVLAEFRDPEGALAAACLTDRLSDGLSALYSFFDPGLSPRSLGSFMVLWLIEEARREGLPYVYLGYWIDDVPNMAYKVRFTPLEFLAEDGWRLMNPV